MIKKFLNLSTIRLILLFGVLVFLYSFSTQRNLERLIKDRKVEFVGSEYLFMTHDSVNKLLIENTNKSSKLKKHALDLRSLERSINNHPYVHQCETYVTVDGVLHVMIQQKEPIARVYHNGHAYYLDYEGRSMPLSDNYTSRVPVFLGDIAVANREEVLKVLRLIHDDLLLNKSITGVELTKRGSLILKNRGFDFDVEFGKPVNVDKKFANYKAFMQKAVQDSIAFQYKKINLRFTQQVVCTK
jgi:cell division protein FtsQ